MRPSARLWYRFGPFRLCAEEGVLERAGEIVSLSPRTFDTLAMLVKNSPNLVTIEELIESVWEGVTVEPANLTQHVFSARKALGDNSQNPTYIQNVPRRGYRFIAPVEQCRDESAEAAAPAALAKEPGKRGWLVVSGLLAAAIVVAAPLVAFLPAPAPEMHILNYVQLTHDGGQKQGPLLIDGKQVIYRSTGNPARMWAVATAGGGEPVPLGSPGEREWDVSKDGRWLLLGSLDANGGTLWSRGIKTGAQAALTEGDSGSWSPDGTRLAVANANTLAILRGKAAIAKIAVAGQAANPRWSMDGRRVRFSVIRADEAALWEVNEDGSAPHQIAESGVAPVVLNGIWNPRGDLFFFTAHTRGSDNIWVSRERRFGGLRQDSKPISLTSGPGDWQWPMPAANDKEIYAIHSVTAPQLTAWDANTQEWKPFWHGTPAYEMDFSRDGRSAVFVQFPDHTLWKAKADGTERVQLTFGELEAHEPHWSPDGKQIAFMSRGADKEWQARIIPAEGGRAEAISPTHKGQGVPTWSGDGRFVVFGDRTEAKPGPRMNIHSVDLKTRKEEDVNNSFGLWSPRFSPDGRYIAAPSFDGTNLAVMRWPNGEWKNALRLRAIENVMWSADSRYLYFKGQAAVDCWKLFRFRLPDGKLETVADLKDFRWAAENWFGLTPQGTPIALYESSPQEVFAIQYEMR